MPVLPVKDSGCFFTVVAVKTLKRTSSRSHDWCIAANSSRLYTAVWRVNCIIFGKKAEDPMPEMANHQDFGRVFLLSLVL